jgi:hypothetical protein
MSKFVDDDLRPDVDALSLGHKEGITFVTSKDDGRYCLSNGKDQCAKVRYALWPAGL